MENPKRIKTVHDLPPFPSASCMPCCRSLAIGAIVLSMFSRHENAPLPPGTRLASSRAFVPADGAAPIYSALVPAGFPSPADDHLEGKLDLHELMVKRPAATFFCRADGDSMTGAGIHSGDLLVVDRSVQPQDGDIVVATLDGGLTVKTLRKTTEGWELAPANPDYPSFPLNQEDGVQIWGVVTFAVSTIARR
uniref:SOS mutagenesis protein UmuD n=1 Tax=Magnetospirillum gryphiswaldense TaxID=55518 RepID=A4TUH6_9PROT|nr:SOS mutagenesis protein UmuD [Magnetospirillum gryphiswaldense MSR-1]